MTINKLNGLEKNILIDALSLLKEKYENIQLSYSGDKRQDIYRDYIINAISEIDNMKKIIDSFEKK